MKNFFKKRKEENKMPKGIILAGGFGTRLKPLTRVTNKHLLPIYDKPMIYYPINTLASAGIQDIMIVTGQESAGDFINLMGNGEEFNVNITYKMQKGAGGIAAALSLCRDYVNGEPMIVILGDNLFTMSIKDYVDEYKENHGHAMVFLKEVPDPMRFGVATIHNEFIEKIVEKPKEPETNLAVVGLYFYNSSVWHVIDTLKPSGRGELEITDLNNWFISQGLMKYKMVEGQWTDAGTFESLYKAATFVREEVRRTK